MTPRKSLVITSCGTVVGFELREETALGGRTHVLYSVFFEEAGKSNGVRIPVGTVSVEDIDLLIQSLDDIRTFLVSAETDPGC